MSKQKTGVKLDARKNMYSSPRRGGRRSVPFKSVGGFVPTVTRLDIPMDNGRRCVLTEESFVELMLTRHMTVTQVKDLGVPWQTIMASRKYYKKKYGPELKKVRSENHGAAMRGNQRGKKLRPGVVLDEGELRRLIDAGMSVFQIARMMSTSEFMVRRNIDMYGIIGGASRTLPHGFTAADLDLLETLESFHPGVMLAAKGYYSNPKHYFETLYLAFIRLCQLVWGIRDWSKRHSAMRESRTLHKSHITFALNRPEMMLSLELLNRGIEHVRCLHLGDNYTVDFFVPQMNLCVEVDGKWHRIDRDTQRRDVEKERRIAELGYGLMRFSDKEAIQDPAAIVRAIEQFGSNQ